MAAHARLSLALHASGLAYELLRVEAQEGQYVCVISDNPAAITFAELCDWTNGQVVTAIEDADAEVKMRESDRTFRKAVVGQPGMN
jgi:hypothetical protein